MASGKRQPSKQKRTQQNRQQRAALQARATNASTPSTSASSTGSGSSSGGGSRSLLGRLRGAATSAPAPRTSGSGSGTRAGRLASSPLADPSAQPPGYRAALTGVLAAVAAIAVSFIVSAPVDGDGDVYTKPSIVAEWSESALQAAIDQPDADGAAVARSVEEWMPERESKRMFLAYFPASVMALLPVLGAILAFRAVRMRASAKVVTRAMYATLFGAILSFSLMAYFLPTVIAVSVAGFQVRRAEVNAINAAAREAAAAGGPADGDDVIDAEVVEPDDGVVGAEIVDGDERT